MVKKKEMVCIRCRLLIGEKENYLRLNEFNDGKELNEKYIHKSCWMEFMNRNAFMKKGMTLMEGAMGYLQRMGIVPEKKEEVVNVI